VIMSHTKKKKKKILCLLVGGELYHQPLCVICLVVDSTINSMRCLVVSSSKNGGQLVLSTHMGKN
jgi:hypothetical protein